MKRIFHVIQIFLISIGAVFGQNWSIFTPSNSAIPDVTVYSETVDNNNRIWVGIACEA